VTAPFAAPPASVCHRHFLGSEHVGISGGLEGNPVAVLIIDQNGRRLRSFFKKTNRMYKFI
jgi:hypothetical protein